MNPPSLAEVRAAIKAGSFETELCSPKRIDQYDPVRELDQLAADLDKPSTIVQVDLEDGAMILLINMHPQNSQPTAHYPVALGGRLFSSGQDEGTIIEWRGSAFDLSFEAEQGALLCGSRKNHQVPIQKITIWIRQSAN